jgi:hypothetical protein
LFLIPALECYNQYPGVIIVELGAWAYGCASPAIDAGLESFLEPHILAEQVIKSTHGINFSLLIF